MSRKHKYGARFMTKEDAKQKLARLLRERRRYLQNAARQRRAEAEPGTRLCRIRVPASFWERCIRDVNAQICALSYNTWLKLKVK